jgi:hypothetical protein
MQANVTDDRQALDRLSYAGFSSSYAGYVNLVCLVNSSQDSIPYTGKNSLGNAGLD